MNQHLLRLLVALPILAALVMGALALAAGSDETAPSTADLVRSYEQPPPIDALFASKPPCAPYNQGLCKLTSYSCFEGICCCTWRTDCDPAHASTECF